MEETVGVSFKENGRIYYFKPNGISQKLGATVIVETEKGLQFATIRVVSKKINEKDLSSPLKTILRLATKEDIAKNKQNIIEAQKALITAANLVTKEKLNMRLIDATFMFDRKQLLFNFIADGRVDFRELAKKLAQIYKTRIELRQIGVRDKAKEIGGIGPCGRPLCCNSFLTDFDSVSINMAKNQYLSLNPTKINGVCGRLLCCLKYEDSTYSDLKEGMPQMGRIIDTPDGKGKVIAIDVLRQNATIELPNKATTSISYKKD